ncbi:hypothetical protein E2R51_15545 [Jeotgalibacillus sp. S-D1]|uniref:ApeA N-terminal domain 1-containing protein n=1 Tax=Jeotgalibacillus sp. S-D1 TaxID=2552189 RepID=UPI00105A42E5|nr:HEPN domain-containing protein [Jeotgalibacillus sp. S-D1]TDL31197.1 hypothetical protein E2R51_15545 [Jeotgalibacillus sp. S-D1]
MAEKKLKDRSLFENFQLRGRWGLEEDELNIIGTLNFSQNKIELDLVGTLEDVEQSLISAFTSNTSSNYPTIYGIAESGERITLLNCYKINTKSRFNGISVEKYEAENAIAGTEFINHDHKFKFITFSTNDLGLWSEINRINTDIVFTEDNEQIFSQTIDFKTIKQNLLEWPLDKFGTTLKENYFINITGTEERNQVYNHKFLFQYEITKDQDMNSLEWFIEKINSLKSLLTLLIGAPLYFESLNIYGEYDQKKINGEQYRKKFKVFHRQQGDYKGTKLTRSKILLPLPEIEDFSKLITLWHEKEDDLKVLVDFINSDHYTSMYAENKFLNVVQTAEIFHRRFSGEKLLTKDERDKYVSERRKLLKILRKDFDEKFATLIENRTSNPDTFSLKERIESLISNLNPTTTRYILGDQNEVDDFISIIVKRRNYLTHLDEERYDEVVKNLENLPFETHQLKGIMLIYILKELGVPEEDSFKRLRSIYRYKSKAQSSVFESPST